MSDPFTSRHEGIVRATLAELFGPPDQRDFAVRLWDGITEGPASRDPAFTIVIRRPGALRRILMPPSELSLSEAYLRDDVDIEGDVEQATRLADQLASRIASPRRLARIARLLWRLPRDGGSQVAEIHAHNAGLSGSQHSKLRDALAVRSHYDVGNDFYALWLDRRMVYSCAYFRHPTDSLDVAQEAKIDLLCRKLRLQPGENLLDIGCGWGALVRHAAEHYGVRATGITLSEPQAQLARARIAAAGLSDRCRIEVRDYRDMGGELFDKIVSVGMYEHVGRSKMLTYFSKAMELLVPGGLFLNHGIVEGPIQFQGVAGLAMRYVWKEGEFVQKYVFPDGDIIRPGVVVDVAERAGFETRDVENLREHYTLTLRHWVHRLEEHRAEAIRIAGEETYRVWRLYMSASAMGFASGRIGIIQTLLSKTESNGRSHLPLTREDLYQSSTWGEVRDQHLSHASS